MTEPSKLVQKAIGRSNATWNSVKQRAVTGIGACACIACSFYTNERLHVIQRTLTSCQCQPHEYSTEMVYKGQILKLFSWDIFRGLTVRALSSRSPSQTFRVFESRQCISFPFFFLSFFQLSLSPWFESRQCITFFSTFFSVFKSH